jgi:hypothetical protein
MFSRPPFSCSTAYDGLILKGTVAFLSPSDVSVTVTSPFSGITCGSHTPAFAMFPKNRNIDDAGGITPKGFAAIEQCLVAAYRLASALYENKEALYARLLAAERAVDAIRKERERIEGLLRAEKRTKKGLFKQGLLPESEYAAFLKTAAQISTRLTMTYTVSSAAYSQATRASRLPAARKSRRRLLWRSTLALMRSSIAPRRKKADQPTKCRSLCSMSPLMILYSKAIISALDPLGRL